MSRVDCGEKGVTLCKGHNSHSPSSVLHILSQSLIILVLYS